MPYLAPSGRFARLPRFPLGGNAVTLFRQLVVAVLVLMALLYGVNGALSLSSARDLVAGQMAIHAADAATSLAVAISQGDGALDPPVLEALFNALSDSGYYQRIELLGADGRLQLAREFAVIAPEVPRWFVRAMALPEQVGRADVVAGWMQVGEVVVVSHPGRAYRQLWQLAGRQLLWFALAAALFCALGLLGLYRLLAPLRRVVVQADAICDQHFLIQEPLPRPPEVRRLAEAMNRMAGRLQQLFNGQAELIGELQRTLAHDPVTGLLVRAEFDARMEAQIAVNGGARQGLLAIAALDDLALINERHGRVEGNDLLRAFGVELCAALSDYPEALVARRQGAEFAIFVADVSDAEAETLVASLAQVAATVPYPHRETLPLRIRLGYTLGEATGHGANLLEEAGRALMQVTPTRLPNFRRYDAGSEASPPLVSRTGASWPELIAEVLDRRALDLLCQPTVSVPGGEVIGHELYSRVSADVLGAMPGPAALLPMVERIGRAADYDRLVLELLPDRVGSLSRVTLNLSAQSLQSPPWLDWLAAFLGNDGALAARLVFEIPERVVTTLPDEVRGFQRLIEPHGCGLGVDHFGLEASHFAYLGSLPLAHVKLHRSLIRDLDQRRDAQFYVKSLAQLVHGREIPLIAEGVEREAQWRALAGLSVDGAQGFFLGNPETLA